MKFLLLITAALAVSCGKISHDYEAGGGVEVRVVVDYPQAQNCFDSELVDTFEKLAKCLELATDKTWTVTTEGEIIKTEDLIDVQPK